MKSSSLVKTLLTASVFITLSIASNAKEQTTVNRNAARANAKDSVFNTHDVLHMMERVADWQLAAWNAKGYKYPKWDWANAVGYTGIFELSKLSKNEVYINTLQNIGNELNWNTGPRRFMADDYCIGQTYALLYMKYRNPEMISTFKQQADSIVNAPFTESLEWKNEIHLREWAWCDALFMGPSALAYLSTATGEPKYLDKACKLWWKTKEYLYDRDEHLYSRDGSFLAKKEKNGKKVFWSRGNGWVLGGIVRVMDNMPKNYPEKKKFISHYKELISKIAGLQQPDGSWHASLLDPQSYPVKETSGTGFYCYAILWGLNNGILKKSEYWPVAQKAWLALTTSVRPDGMLGYVQRIGGSPDAVTDMSTEIYGTGAFLLAGSQLYQYLNKPQK